MDSYLELRELAKHVGCEQIVENAERQAELLLDQNHTRIVITGGRGSGKTRLINRMIGFEVWEEGRMDDEEKPLRVAFEPLDDDARFNCLMAANRQWHNEAAILYELREEDILCDDCHTKYLEDMDVVLYLISARAPFSINQVNALRALDPLKRYVILTGLETVEPKDQDQVLEYVNRFIDALNLPPVIVWREDTNQDLGREIRNLLPAYDELQQLRKKHIEYNKQNLIATIRAAAKALQEENSAAWAEKAAMDKQSAASANRDSLEWVNLLNELREMHLHARETVTASLGRECDNIVRTIIQSGRDQYCSAEWKKNVPALLERKLSRLIEQYAGNALDTYCDDIDTLSQSAKTLKLRGYSESDFVRLCDAAGEKLSPEKLGHISWADNIPTPLLCYYPNAGLPTDKTKVLLSTGVAVGFFTLAPFSLAISLLGVVGSVGVGAAYYKKVSDDEIFAALEKGMKDYQSIFQNRLNSALDEAYEDAKKLLGDKARGSRSQTNVAEVVPFEEKSKTLNEIVSRCDELLNKK